jgi:hypothetical protein
MENFLFERKIRNEINLILLTKSIYQNNADITDALRGQVGTGLGMFSNIPFVATIKETSYTSFSSRIEGGEKILHFHSFRVLFQ